VKEKFNWEPTPSWVSKWAKKKKLSSHMTQKRPEKRNREELQEEIESFRVLVNNDTLEMQKNRKARPRFWHMDESGVYDDHHVQKSYSPIGTTPFITTTDSHNRDTIVVAIANDGQKLKRIMIIQHRRKSYSSKTNTITGEKISILKDKGKQGMVVEDFRTWVKEFFLSNPSVNQGDTLVLDNLSAHSDPAALGYLREKGENTRRKTNEKKNKKKEKTIETYVPLFPMLGINVLFFPKGGAPDLSMCDNSFFKHFKSDLAKKKWQTKEEKHKAIEEVWEEFKPFRIQGYWRKCGYEERKGPTKQRLRESKTLEEEEHEVESSLHTTKKSLVIRQPTLAELFSREKRK